MSLRRLLGTFFCMCDCNFQFNFLPNVAFSRIQLRRQKARGACRSPPRVCYTRAPSWKQGNEQQAHPWRVSVSTEQRQLTESRPHGGHQMLWRPELSHVLWAPGQLLVPVTAYSHHLLRRLSLLDERHNAAQGMKQHWCKSPLTQGALKRWTQIRLGRWGRLKGAEGRHIHSWRRKYIKRKGDQTLSPTRLVLTSQTDQLTSLFFSFLQLVLNAYHVPGCVPGTKDRGMNGTDRSPASAERLF